MIDYRLTLLPGNSHLVIAERRIRCNRHVLAVYFDKMGIQSQRFLISFLVPEGASRAKTSRLDPTTRSNPPPQASPATTARLPGHHRAPPRQLHAILPLSSRTSAATKNSYMYCLRFELPFPASSPSAAPQPWAPLVRPSIVVPKGPPNPQLWQVVAIRGLNRLVKRCEQ